MSTAERQNKFKKARTVFGGITGIFLAVSLFMILVPSVLLSTASNYYTNELSSRLQESNYNIVKQKAITLDLIFDNITTQSSYLMQNHNLLRTLRLSDLEGGAEAGNQLEAQQIIRDFVYTQPHIYSITIRTANGMHFDSAFAESTMNDELLSDLAYEEFALDQGVITEANHKPLRVFSLYARLYDIRDFQTVLADLKINIRDDTLSAVYQDEYYGPGGNYHVVSPSGKVVSSSTSYYLGKEIDDVTQIESSYEEMFANGSGFKVINSLNSASLLTYHQLFSNNWFLVNTVNADVISSNYKAVRNATIVAVISSVFVSLFLIVYFLKAVLLPLQRMRSAMISLGEEDFGVQITTGGALEIRAIQESFNNMSLQLSTLINEVYLRKVKQREAELAALQSQINPHFLYNTLDTIYWQCRMDGSYTSAELVRNLSKLFRLSLNRGQEMTSVREEIELLHAYVYIEQVRHKNRIDFSISVEPGTENCKTVKSVLQPLVENAIKHGINQGTGQGEIRTYVYRRQNNLEFLVWDDGVGMDAAAMNQKLGKMDAGTAGYGVFNVHSRIRLHFGEAYGLHYESKEEAGTMVIVRQPFRSSDR